MPRPIAEGSARPLEASLPDSQRRVDANLDLVVIIAVVVLVIAAVGLLFLLLPAGAAGLCVAALVPALLVVQHGIQLRILRPQIDSTRELADPIPGAASPSALADSSSEPPDATRLSYRDTHQSRQRRKCLRVMRQEAATQYGWRAISLDYVFPTILAAIAGLLPALAIAFRDKLPEVENEGIYHAALLGALGAYVYVMMMLGQRTFQRDITPGAAVWSAVQLFVGPVLGGVVAVLIDDSTRLNGFTKQTFYFFAGLAPRQFVSIIYDAVQRFWAGGTIPTRKVIPLAMIRGVTPQVEDRLLEEGITDVYLLAAANPVRLSRNTPFDERQIVAWIDDSMLRSTLPEAADALQKDGVTGAVDLAYYWEMADGAPDIEAIKRLAERTKLDEGTLADVCRRLDEDSQVQTVWALYQYSSDPTPVAPPSAAATATVQPAAAARRSRRE